MNRETKRRLEQAGLLYQEFSGHKPESLGAIPFPDNPKAVLVIGDLIDVGYVTMRDGKVIRYRHQFRARSRPLLTSAFDGKQLFILGGEYDFTDRGIEDR